METPGWQHAEEMGAAGQPVQGPDGKRGMTVRVLCRLGMRVPMGMDVEMTMALAVMRVLVDMHMAPKRLMESP